MTLRELLKVADIECVLNQIADIFIKNQFVKPKTSAERIIEVYKNTVKELTSIQGSSKTGEIVVLRIFDDISDEFVMETLYRAVGDNRRYSIILMPREDLIDLEVCAKSIEKYGKEEVATLILYELTFFGFTEKERKKEIKKTVKSLEKSEKCKKYYTLEDIVKKYGLKTSEESEEEKQKRREKMLEAIRINNKVYREFGFETVEENY
ncbi:MAG: hypothetical protein NC131_15305 [Roseburia sp.]|nr:hypothetical protein [Roseburia sp.]